MKLYNELAPWWPVMSPPSEYGEEAAFYRTSLDNASRTRIDTLLELGSGGGNNASHMKAHYRELVLVDLSATMIANSRAINPELAHYQGDMRTVRLGREFDAVFIHDAICYMTTEADLRQAIDTAFVHCRPGGVVLLAPDYLRENFEPGVDHGGNDDAGGRAMRWLEWRRDPDPADTTYIVDYAYLLSSAEGTMRVEHDRHIEGLFTRETWLRLSRAAGFQSRALAFEHSELEPGKHEVFVCLKPSSAE